MTSRVPRRRFGVQRGSRSDRGSYACVVWCSAPEDEAWGEGWVWDGVRMRLGVRVRARLRVRAGGAGGGDRVGDALELEGRREHLLGVRVWARVGDRSGVRVRARVSG